MVELKEHRKVRKLKNRYILETKSTYPLINVQEMLKAWKTKVGMAQEFIDKFDEKLAQAINDADAEGHRQIEKLREDYERFGNLSREEQIEELFKVSDETRQQQKDIIDNKDQKIEEGKEHIRRNMEQIKLKAQQEIDELQDAITLWENPSQK